MTSPGFSLPLFVHVVTELQPGTDLKAFLTGRIQGYTAARFAQGAAPAAELTSDQLGPILSAAEAEYQTVLSAPLPLADPAQDYGRLPAETRAVIAGKASFLLRMMAGRFPPVPNESLADEQITCLLSPWNGYDDGVVVYRQYSNRATLAILLPLVRLDIGRGALQLRLDQQVVTTTWLSAMPPPQMRATYDFLDPATAAAVGVGINWGDALMTFASSALFVLPEPYGVLAASAASVAHMFFGGQPTDVLQTALNSVITQLGTILDQDRIHDAAAKVADATEWLYTSSTTIKDLGDQSHASDFVTRALGKIDDVDAPNTPLRGAVFELWQMVQDPGVSLANRENALQVLSAGVGIYLTYLRVRIQMQAWLASSKGTPDLQLGYYDTFRQECSSWDTNLSQATDMLTTARLAEVGPVVRGKDSAFCTSQACVNESYYYGFTDSDPDALNLPTKWHDSSETKTSCGTPYEDDIPHQDQANAGREAYVRALADKLTAQYATVVKAVKTWEANLQQWEEGLTPLTPTSAPAVSGDMTKWQGQTPLGPWVTGAKVRYAAFYKNDSGQSPLGPWGTQVTIGAHAHPLLVGVPVDPLKLATSRHICRQLVPPSTRQVNYLELHGGGDFVTVGPLFRPPITSDAATVEAWIKTTADVQQTVVLAQGPPGARPRVTIGPSSQIGVYWSPQGSGGGYGSSDTRPVTDGAWHHIAVVFDKGQITFYKDGVATPDTGTMHDLETSDDSSQNALQLGAGLGSATTFTGQLYDVRVWRVARSSTDISGSMLTTPTGKELGLAACVSVADGTVRDLVTGGQGALAGSARIVAGPAPQGFTDQGAGPGSGDNTYVVVGIIADNETVTFQDVNDSIGT